MNKYGCNTWSFTDLSGVISCRGAPREVLKNQFSPTTYFSRKMLNKFYDIAQDPWWRPQYCGRQEVADIEKSIRHLQKAVKSESLDEDFLRGFQKLHHQKYLLECISGESNIKMTYEDVDELQDVNFLQILYYRFIKTRKFRLLQKFNNLDKAAKYLLSVPQSSSLKEFNLDFVQNVHNRLGKKLIQNAGKFRTMNAKPAGEDFLYLEPHLIEEKLEKLLEQCRMKFSDPKLQLLDAVKYGACFFAYFLYIHPFSNGNGRTARLLLSHLLRQFTSTPLSLYTSGEMRVVYLQCLRESQYDYGIMKPTHLSRFILEAIEKEYFFHCSTMDVPVH